MRVAEQLLRLTGGPLLWRDSTKALQYLVSTIILISQIVLEGATRSDLSWAVLSKLGHRWDNDFYKQHFDERRGKKESYVKCTKARISTLGTASGTN